MVYALLVAAAIIFLEAFLRLDTLAPVRFVFRAGPEGLRTVTSAALSDDEKEVRLRQLSGRLLRATAEMVIKLVFALTAATALLWLGAAAANVPYAQIERALLSLPVIAGLVVVTIVYARFRRARA